MEHLEFMEQQAEKNMQFHLDNMDCLAGEANTTLTLLYALVGASFMGTVSLFDPAKPCFQLSPE